MTDEAPAPRAWTDVFVERPVLAAVISIVLVLLGIIAFGRLPVRETPQLQPPTVSVTTVWPGADPAIVETDVTEILEREINGIEGIRTLTSTSREQVSQITVEFELERDLEDAANDVRARVARARSDLPEEVEEPTVEKADADASPVMFLRLSADDKDLLELTEIADTQVRERLQTVAGVSSVDIFGEQKYAMRVELDPAALIARGVTIQQLEDSLRSGNVDAPAGRVEGEAIDLSVRVDAGLNTPEAFAQLVVAEVDGALVRLQDVGRVRLGAENERTAARSEGIPSITVAILPQAQANIIHISDEVQQRLPAIRSDLPDGVDLAINYDRTVAVRSSIVEVEHTLLVAFGLVVVVIFAFLRDWRSTLVPSLAIPVSIVGTFLFLWLAGFSINVFTLFGLVLAIGIVVDDAIVVLENIYRRIEDGEDPRTAAILGTRQIVFAVLATTISLVMVFLPIIFTGGTTGRLFLEFGSTVAVAVVLSSLVALTLTPTLCALLLRPAGDRGRVYLATERVFEVVQRAFALTLGWLLRVPVLAVGLVCVALVAGGLGFFWLPREFFPLEDRNVFFVRTTAAEGTSFPWMDARMAELEPELMAAVPERKAMLTRVASGPGGVMAASNSGMFIVPLVPKEERDRSQQEIVAAVRALLSDVTAFQTIPIQFPTVGRGFTPPLQLVLLHPDFAQLAAILPDFVAEVRRIPGLSAVNEDLKLNRPELTVAVDRDKAAAAGVSPRDIARTLQVLTASLELSQFKRGSRSYPVLVGLGPEFRATPTDLARLEVRTRDGGRVPLGNLVRFTEQSAASSRFHVDRSPSATISANLDGITLDEGIARVEALARERLPPGFRTTLAGQSRDYADSNSQIALVFGLAIALVYLTLAAQFDSFVDPLGILVSVPLALAGAFVALAILGMTLSFFAQVGLILLVGLVTKNGILIVEYANQLRASQGSTIWDAAAEAARIRFRPVLMTSISTIVGAMPIALGVSSESRAPLGVTVVAGMAVATALTLYVTPVTYALLASAARWARPAPALAVGLLWAWPSEAADALALGDALAHAMDTNFDLRGQAWLTEAADAQSARARAALLPTLTATGSAIWGRDPRFIALGTAGPIASATARAVVPVLDASSWSALRAARLRWEAATLTEAATREAILGVVGFAYVDLLRAEQQLAEAEALLARSERLAAQAADRVEVGVSAPIEHTRAEVVRQQDHQRRIAAQTERQAARLRLLEILGLPLDADLTVGLVGPVAEAPLGDGTRPDLAAARAQAQAARIDERAARGAVVPTLDAVGTAGVIAIGGFVDDETGQSTTNVVPTTSVGVEASMPIFTGTARSAEVRERRAWAARAAVSVDDLEREVAVQVQLADAAVRDGFAAWEVARSARALAEQEVTLAEDRFTTGVASNLEVVEAQARLAGAMSASVDALARYNIALLDAWRARGRLTELVR